MIKFKLPVREPYKTYLFNSIYFIMPLVFYGLFMATKPGYVDSCLVLNNAYELSLSPWVNNHNLFSLLAWLFIKIFSSADEFVVANTFSMVCGAGTIFFTYLLASEISKNRIIASVVAFVIMISHSLAWHSTMLEVYTLNSVLIMAMLYCFYRYFDNGKIIHAYFGAFVWGLGLSNHILMGLFVFAIIFFIIAKSRVLKLKNILIGIGCFLAGLLPFLIIFLQTWIQRGSLSEVIGSNTGGEFRSLMFSSDGFWFWKLNYLMFFVYQFCLVAVFAGIKGFRVLFNKKPFSIFFLLAFGAQFIWSFNYHIWDSYAFSLPVYIMFTVPLTYGLASFKKERFRKIVLALVMVFSVSQIILYATIDKIKPVTDYINDYPMVDMVKDRFDPVKYFLSPFKRNFTRVDDYISEFEKKIPQGAYVYDNIYDYPFNYYYQQIKKDRTDIRAPIIFVFWVTEEEKISWSRNINSVLDFRGKAYMAPFVLDNLRDRLDYDSIEKIPITSDDFLFLVKKEKNN